MLFLCCSFWIRKTLASTETPFSWYFFFLGAGFMLIEVKSISDLSLLFGSTWVVNSVVNSAILLMILLANVVVVRLKPRSVTWAYVGLAACLLVTCFLRPDPLSGLDDLSKTLIGGAVSGTPLFFAGILFASAFRTVKDIPAAFGANLLGALVGGILENFSMIVGITLLNVLALAIYALSLIALHRPDWQFLNVPKITAIRK